MTIEERKQREIERWKERALKARRESKELKKSIREMKRVILFKMQSLEEEIKDLMYMGDRK